MPATTIPAPDDGPGAALERLKAEVVLNREFAGTYEATFLALARTWQALESLGRQFFAAYDMTDVQFNVLMILGDAYGQSFRQHQLADILVVNRASIGGVLERMERRRWIDRVPDPEDRRAIRVRISDAGLDKLQEVRGAYYLRLAELFEPADAAAQVAVIGWCDALRRRIDQLSLSVRGS
ncbi:MAG: MarR family transcriptional regulator [Proteobacteria bacterium]|nr:MarR family transcriptional regulator [Pseudomonadota bacterium]